MKAKKEPYFKDDEAYPENIALELENYDRWFLSDVKDMYAHLYVDYDLVRGYSLHNAEREGDLTPEQQAQLRKLDIQKIRNWFAGKYRTETMSLTEEISEYFNWLIDHIDPDRKIDW